MQLQIKRVDPFKNGSCFEKDGLENGSIYNKRHKGSKYSVQVCSHLVILAFVGSLEVLCPYTLRGGGGGGGRDCAPH